LGVITQGFRVRWNAETEAWDGDFVSDTHLSIPLGDASGRPIVWVYNNNVEVANLGRGGKGGVGHWEGFGPPNHSDAAHRNLVRSWNLGAAMREHIKMGTWRVIVGQEATNGQIAVQVGAFVHEVPVPAGFNVIEGMRYVATADEQHFGLIPNESLIRIELHDTAPTDVPGGAKNKNEEDSKHNKKGENDIHDDKRKEMVDIVNSFVVSVANTLAIFRTVTPTNRIGGQLTEDELPLFTRDRFQSGLGEFLLDLGKRDGHWVLVRTIDGKEGWVHERGLQLLERPWNLPSCPPFNVTWSPHNWSWCQDEIDDQLRKRGLSSSGSRETDFGRIINYERTRTASLPMKVVDYDDEEQERPRWSDSSEILDKELVLEAAVVDNVATEITSFDRETWVIGSDELIHVPQAAWGINMTPEELTALMATVRVTSTASEQVLNKAEERKSKEKEPIKKSDEKAKRVALDAVEGLSFSGEKKSKKQELGAEEDGPSSPKEKGNSKNSNGKHLLEDGEEDELAQEPQQPPKKSPKTKIKK
jgi:hypothetical protein